MPCACNTVTINAIGYWLTKATAYSVESLKTFLGGWGGHVLFGLAIPRLAPLPLSDLLK